MEFLLQPDVYKTGSHASLLDLLGDVWIKSGILGRGTIYIISGFANYNGGVRFLPFFADHIHKGGKVVAIFSGSAQTNLSSRQIVEALLKCGAQVFVINRKRLLHAKCYGYDSGGKDALIVSSGNFTGPGMTQNAEATLYLDNPSLAVSGFSWKNLYSSIMSQAWSRYEVNPTDVSEKEDPVWSLLYDEVHGSVALTDDQESTMLVTLSHSDTSRIQAAAGTNAGKGSQYFWLTKAAFDFFPPLTEKNKRGTKNTYSCLINIKYMDLLGKIFKSRVTFEADNNLDFRLETAALRYTKLADENDIAALTRTGEYDYELRIITKNNPAYGALIGYATSYIGQKGKRFGYISNSEFEYQLLHAAQPYAKKA